MNLRPITKKLGTGLVAGTAALALAACTSNDPDSSGESLGGGTSAAEEGSNDETGDKVVIGFSAPAADHGWMGSITESTKKVAEQYDDVELLVAEGTNDVSLQISQVETFINDGVDAIVLLPFDGAAMTPVAIKAMEAGIPVVNVDREFNDPNAARVTVLGDNYGMGVSAGTYICEQIGDEQERRRRRDRGHRLAAADPGPQPGLRRRALRLRPRRRQPRRRRLHRRGRREGRVQPAPGRAPDRRAVEPRRRPGRGRPRRDRERRPRRVHHGGRRRLGQRDALHPGRRRRPEGDRHLPLDPGCGRRQAGPAPGAAEGDGRPRRGRGAAHGAALRAGRHPENVDQFLDTAFES